jgi:hypothetical protein
MRRMMSINPHPIEVPGAHILKCPECGVPIDASEPDNFEHTGSTSSSSSSNSTRGHPAKVTVSGLYLECQNCHYSLRSDNVLQILKEKDGYERCVIQGMTSDGLFGLAIAFDWEH